MNNTNAHSSTASKKEVKKDLNTNEMGFTFAGGLFTADKEKILMKETETFYGSIPMFDVVEKSFGKYKKGINKAGKNVIITNTLRYVEAQNGKYVATPRTKVAER